MRSLTLAMVLIQMISARCGEPQPDKLKDFGPEVKGLRTKVALSRAAFPVGQPVETKFVKRNVSQENLKIWHSGFWPNHMIVVKDAAGQEAPFTALGKQCRAAFNPGGHRDKNFPIELKPDQEDASEGQHDLARFFDLTKPGQYTVEFIYEEKQGGWEGRVVSNSALFTISK